MILTLAVYVNVEASEDDRGLSFECTAIPGYKDKICFVITASPHGQFDDVVFYRKTADGELFLLSSQRTGGSAFAGVGFSDQGNYMWVSWADEGHPYFSFYKTDTFLNDGEHAESLSILSVYGFESFVSFTDDGKVLYTFDDGVTQECLQDPCVNSFYINEQKNK